MDDGGEQFPVEEFQEALSSGQGTVDGVTESPVAVELPNGEGSAEVQGRVVLENGVFEFVEELSAGDSIIYGGRGVVFDSGMEFEAEYIERLETDAFLLVDARDVVYRDGVLSAENAQAFTTTGSSTQDSAFLSNIAGLEADSSSISIGFAQTIQSGCVRLDDVDDATVSVDAFVHVQPRRIIEFTATDCSAFDSTIHAGGEVSISKSEPSSYVISASEITLVPSQPLQGINFEYKETVSANRNATIEMDPAFGISCVTIQPIGAYHYADETSERDFSIRVTSGEPYRLCLRKSITQHFDSYAGIVDFVDKTMELSGEAEYRRYPIRLGKIAGLSTEPVYQGTESVLARLFYFDDFMFLRNLFVRGIRDGGEATTAPNNYFRIIETTVGGEQKRLLHIDRNITAATLTESIIANYSTDSGMPEITIRDNVLVQDNGRTRVTVLPPGDERISALLNG